MILEYLVEIVLQVPELVGHLLLNLPLATFETMPELAPPTEAKAPQQVGKGHKTLPEFLHAQPTRARTTDQAVNARLTLPEFLIARPGQAKVPEQIGERDPSQRPGCSSRIWDRELDGV
jgi:hypothetical protein